jgi:uncharacterized protein (TIGR03067 family)
MQRANPIALGLLLSMLSLSAQGAPEELADLQGKWKLTAVEVDEREAELPGDLPILEIKNDNIFYGNEHLATLVVDASANPKTVDLQFQDPRKTYEGIYFVEPDTLRLCVNNTTDGAKQRPAELATKDHPTFRLLVLKRASADDESTVRGFVGMALKLDEETKDVVIANIIPESPAKKADLQEGDVLVKVAGAPATDLQSTVAAVRKVKPGSKLVIALRRDGKDQEVTVTAGIFPFHFFGILD